MGAALCLLSAAAFGVMAVFAKLAYRDGVDVSTLLFARFGIAALVLLSIAVARGSLRRLDRRAVLAGLGMGALGYAAQSTLYFEALERVDASQVALVFSSYPLLVMIAAVLSGRERASRRRGLALALAWVGIALVLTGGSAAAFDLGGASLALSAAAVYTGYILVGDHVARGLPPVDLAALVCSGATMTFLVSALVRGGPHLGFPTAGWLWLVLLSLVCTVAAILMFFAGITRVGPTVTALLGTLEPVVTIVSAAVVFHEQLSATQAFGGAAVLGAVLVVQWPARQRLAAPAPPRPPALVVGEAAALG